MNLHEIVRNAICNINTDETVTLYHSTGISNVLGVITPTYETREIVSQWQPADKETLDLLDATERLKEVCNVFLLSDNTNSINSVKRTPISSTGDYFYRNNEWWLVTDLPEDWNGAGWECVTAIKQVTAPKGVTV